MAPAIVVLGGALLGVLAAACSGGGDAAATQDPAAGAGADAPAEAAAAFPTGPAVTVSVGFEAPDTHVASTGAYLPVNGKPTLVYVDAIW